MKGSSGIPKKDIDSTTAPTPTTTADTNAQLQNTTEPHRRKKTRKPPLVKGRQPAYLQGDDAKTSKVSAFKEMSQTPSSKQSVSPLSNVNMNQHSAPVVTSSTKNSQLESAEYVDTNKIKEIAASLALRIRPAFIEKDLDQLEIVIKGLEDNNFRFNRSPFIVFEEIKEFVLMGGVDVITLMQDGLTDQAEDLLVRMIRLGFNMNVVDDLENSVLMRACKAGRYELVKVLLTECPKLRKNWLNVFGQNAAMMAYRYGNSQLYPLLDQAGISRCPENPVINFYLSSFDLGGYDSSDSEIEEYLELFKENNYMNLADENGQTILFHAVINEDVDFVSFLCEQKQFPNVTLRDANQKSVFDFIKQIKDPAKKVEISRCVYNLALETVSLQKLAKYTYSDGVLGKQ